MTAVDGPWNLTLESSFRTAEHGPQGMSVRVQGYCKMPYRSGSEILDGPGKWTAVPLLEAEEVGGHVESIGCVDATWRSGTAADNSNPILKQPINTTDDAVHL
ncbi:MAG: hypothetical protein LBU24_05700 [Methanocalculaceae archaeon]|nr:hypothetical protein [Methanocalculaceae archaeon]